jgi:hypothetical protein
MFASPKTKWLYKRNSIVISFISKLSLSMQFAGVCNVQTDIIVQKYFRLTLELAIAGAPVS